MWIAKNEAPEVWDIAHAAFPNWRGYKLQTHVFKGPMRLESYWSGGSRDSFVFVELASPHRQASVPQNGDGHTDDIDKLTTLPNGVALVQHVYYRGRDLGCRVFVAASNMNRLALPAIEKLTPAEKVVLIFTASLKNSYGGRKDIRFTEAHEATDISQEQWHEAQEQLKTQKMLTAQGAITPKGRNACPNMQTWRAKHHFAFADGEGVELKAEE